MSGTSNRHQASGGSAELKATGGRTYRKYGKADPGSNRQERRLHARRTRAAGKKQR